MFMRSFYACKSQKCKKTDGLTVFFCTLGSACLKATHKMLVKFTPGVGQTYREHMVVSNGDYSFTFTSLLILLDLATCSQKDHKLLSAANILCSKKIGN